jgi:hypothetical protein
MTGFLLASLPAALLAFSAASHAGTKVLTSAPISNDAGGVSCVATNAGSKTVTVTTVETVGAALGPHLLEEDPIVLGPGDFFGRVSAETFGYCRFNIEGSTKGLRAAACRFEAGSGYGTNLDCVEAR